RREIILSRRVTHENVCRVFDLVEVNGEEFVSMEFIPGRTLKDVEDEEKTLPLGRGLAIGKKICRGLAAAHRIGVLHRDLKPENVIVGTDGTPRLMDFGIAVETAVYRGEKEDTVPGTPQFLAPELLRGMPRTGTWQAEADRGTCLLRRPGSFGLVSQNLEGCSVARSRLLVGRGIAGDVAPRGGRITIRDAYKDPRFDSRTDLCSGFT